MSALALALTELESARLTACEHVIEGNLQGFRAVGEALMVIRDGRLYRTTHRTFADYCEQRWDLKRAHGYRLIEAAEVAQDLEAVSPNGDIQTPATESVARELAPLKGDQAVMAEVWAGLQHRYGPARITAGLVREAVAVRIANEDRADRRAERVAGFRDTSDELLRMGRFPVLVADPPWRYEYPQGDSRRIENHYPTLPLADIMALEVPAASDAVLFLWVPAPLLLEGAAVLEAWGFTYRSGAVWVKDRIGMGYYFRQRFEHVLLGRRGDMPPPLEANRPDNVIEAPRGRHSEKPAGLYERVEAMYPGLPKVELFARQPRPGWHAWGNEVSA